MKAIYKFLGNAISAKGEMSTKRLLVLFTGFFFNILLFVVLVLLVLVMTKAMPATQLDRQMFFALLDNVVLYAVITIWLGYAFITASDAVAILGKKFEALLVRAQSGAPDTKVEVGNVEKADIKAGNVTTTDKIKPTDDEEPTKI